MKLFSFIKKENRKEKDNPQYIISTQNKNVTSNINIQNNLILKRFCGEEKYPVLKAEWYILDGDGTWDDPYSLQLEIKFGQGSELSNDTKFLGAQPNWKVSFSALSLKKEDLKVGMKMENQNAEGDEEAVFYYCEHQPTIQNNMQVLKINGNCLLIKLSAKTIDINYYDGSKPLNELQLISWFEQMK